MHLRAIALLLFFLTTAASAQTYRDELRLARQAVARGDLDAHLAHLHRVLEMKHDRIGRPYYHYQIARAHALRGEKEIAIEWLETGWEEAIEGPMMSLRIGEGEILPIAAIRVAFAPRMRCRRGDQSARAC